MQALDASGRELSDTDASGGGGIRTHGRCDPTTVFKTVDGSATTPIPAKTSRRISDRTSLPFPYGPAGLPPDLAAVIDAWPNLPEPIRAGILAMVKATNAPARPSGASEKA
jgi:hypothetical protein